MATRSRHRLAAPAAVLAAALAVLAPAAAQADPAYTFFNFDEPNATTGTVANGINNAGQVVGSYDTSGFLMNPDGTFTDILAGGSLNLAIGINNAGQIVGSFTDANGDFMTFLRQPDGTYAAVPPPGSGTPIATGLNDAGSITVNAGGTAYVTDATGAATALPLPAGAMAASANGVANDGTVVGTLQDDAGSHGFLYNLANGTYTLFDDPLGVGATFATALNAAGQVVGFFNDGTANHTFLRSADGGYTTLDDASGLYGTVALGINDLGSIVGYYTDDAGQHGFAALLPSAISSGNGASPTDVPEPASLMLLLSAAGMAAALRKRGRA